MNRITDAIAALDVTLAGISQEKRETLERTATMDAGLSAQLGDLATRAMLDTVLTLDEAQTLYAIHSTFATETLAARITYLQVAAEVLALRVGINA